MGLTVTAEVLRLGLRDPFVIARSDHDAGHFATTVVIELRDDRYPGIVGLGEGYPDRFYGETPATLQAVLPLLVEAVGQPELTPDGLERAGLGKLRFHDLRHTFASLLIAEGLNVVFVSRQMGHASPDITLRVYAHVWDSAQHSSKASAALDAVYTGSS